MEDRWLVNPKLTLNLGVRYEKVRSEATGGIVGVDTDTIVPRLAASYDPAGDGKTVLQASYAHYSGKYSEAQFAGNTSVGNPAQLVYVYTGPESQGRDFAPGFDVSNYDLVAGTFPTANIFFEPGLSAPITREMTFSVGRDLWSKGFAKVTFTNRHYDNFVEDFTDDPSAAGKVDVVFNGVNYGTFDKGFFRNSDDPQRDYSGLLMQANYRLRDNLQVEGHWTVQLRNNGNFEGEGQNAPGISSLVGDYPEILSPSRNFPTGRTDDFQRHKVRLWAIYTQRLGRFGSVDIAHPNSPKDAFGLPTGYIEGSSFGTATRNAHYPAWRPGQTGGRTFLCTRVSDSDGVVVSGKSRWPARSFRRPPGRCRWPCLSPSHAVRSPRRRCARSTSVDRGGRPLARPSTIQELSRCTPTRWDHRPADGDQPPCNGAEQPPGKPLAHPHFGELQSSGVRFSDWRIPCTRGRGTARSAC